MLGALLLHCLLTHADDTPDAVTSLHVRERLVNLVKRLPVGDELVDLEAALEVVVNETG